MRCILSLLELWGCLLQESSLTLDVIIRNNQMSLAGISLEGMSSDHAGKTCGDT